MMDNSFVPQVVCALIPVVLSPLVAELLARRGNSARSTQLNQLLSRANLVEKLRAWRPEGDAAGEYSKSLQAEIDDIVGDLAAIRTLEAQRCHQAATTTTPAWRLLLLLHPQASRRAEIYRGAFYLLGAIVLVGLIGVAMQSPSRTDAFKMGLGLAVYVIAALLFRAAAVRENIRQLKQMKEREAAAA